MLRTCTSWCAAIQAAPALCLRWCCSTLGWIMRPGVINCLCMATYALKPRGRAWWMRHTHLNCWWNVRLGWTISCGACASSAAMSRCALQPSWLQTACMVNWYSTCCCVSHNQPLPRMAANSCHLCNCPQPMLVHAVLAALPTSVRHLVLQVDCRSPLLNLLRRFPQLDSVAIGYRQEGNGADVQWAGRGAAAVLPKLTALRLNYRDEPRLGNTHPRG